MADFGDGSPREEYGSVDPYAPSVANGQISPEWWAEYQKDRRRKMILGLLGTVGGMAGAGAAGYALGGGSAGGAAGSATLPAAATEGMLPMSVAAPAGAGMAGGVGAGAGAGAGAGLAAAGGAAKNFLGLSPRDWMTMLPLMAGTVGSALQRPPDMTPTTATTDPNLQRLIQSMQGRLDQSEPLYKSIVAMANGLLPMQYQNGGAGRG